MLSADLDCPPQAPLATRCSACVSWWMVQLVLKSDRDAKQSYPSQAAPSSAFATVSNCLLRALRWRSRGRNCTLPNAITDGTVHRRNAYRPAMRLRNKLTDGECTVFQKRWVKSSGSSVQRVPSLHPMTNRGGALREDLAAAVSRCGSNTQLEAGPHICNIILHDDLCVSLKVWLQT